MITSPEPVLAVLHARLQPLAALVLRDEALPERIPAAGLTILRDGQPGEPEVTLSPLGYHYQHRAELEVVVQAGTGRASAFDGLIVAIGAALEADPTLGGLSDWVAPEAPASVDLPVEGAAALAGAGAGRAFDRGKADPAGHQQTRQSLRAAADHSRREVMPFASQPRKPRPRRLALRS